MVKKTQTVDRYLCSQLWQSCCQEDVDNAAPDSSGTSGEATRATESSPESTVGSGRDGSTRSHGRLSLTDRVVRRCRWGGPRSFMIFMWQLAFVLSLLDVPWIQAQSKLSASEAHSVLRTRSDGWLFDPEGTSKFFWKYGDSLILTCNILLALAVEFHAWRLAVVAFLESNGFSEIDVNCKKSSSFGLVRDWAAVACKHFWLSHAFTCLRTFKLRNWDQTWDSGTYPLHEAAKQDVSCQLPTVTSVTGWL